MDVLEEAWDGVVLRVLMAATRAHTGLRLESVHTSTDAQRADAQARRWDGRPYTHLEHPLDSERPEAVWIRVTPDRHGE